MAHFIGPLLICMSWPLLTCIQQGMSRAQSGSSPEGDDNTLILTYSSIYPSIHPSINLLIHSFIHFLIANILSRVEVRIPQWHLAAAPDLSVELMLSLCPESFEP